MKNFNYLLIRFFLATLICLGLFSSSLRAQMRVGQPAGLPDGSAALEVNGGPYSSGSPFRGIAPPKVALSSSSSAAPITNPVAGLLIYNTAKAGDVTPGYYYWDSSKWLRFNTVSNAGARSVNGQNIPAYLINQVASLSSPDIIYIADPGREGIFRYVSGSTATVDGAITLDASNGRYQRIVDAGIVNVKWFGAVGDGTTDDSQAIVNALNSPYNTVIIPATAAYYKIASDVPILSNLTIKKIMATGATILNSDTTKRTWLFQNCNGLAIEGGTWGYTQQIHQNGNNSQHVFQFDVCQNILVNMIHVTSSPEMGMAITGCNQAIVQNSVFEHTWRDGIYCRYSANVKVLNNRFSNIKDDAMSFHDKDNYDPGVDAQKTSILVGMYHYSQASNYVADNNTVENSMKGFSSVGGANLTITNNTFINLVQAGVDIHNIQNADPASITGVLIAHNQLKNVCSSQTINGKNFDNTGQSGTGRAAIFVGSTGGNTQVNNGETTRLSNIHVANNTVNTSGANGFWANLVDGLQLTNNVFINCSAADASKQLGGIPVEISGVNNLQANNNTVMDTRSTVGHVWGYILGTVTGYSESWNIVNRISGDALILNSNITNDALKRGIPQSLGVLDSSSPTDWNIFKSAGSYQVTGANGWTSSINTPTSLANAGTLTVEIGGDTETQTYTDNYGNRAWRQLFGLTSNQWSPWTFSLTSTALTTKLIPQSLGLLDLDNTALNNWNTLKTAGSYQVTGYNGWNTSVNTPTSLANFGTLTIEVGGDTETQTYTDNQGRRTWRQLFGLTSSNWTAWSSQAVSQTDFRVGSAQQSASGSASAFAFPHGLGVQPSYISVESASPDADRSNIKFILADPTSITVIYKTAPPAGNNNLIWYWSARK